MATRILWEQAHPIEGKDLLLAEPEVFIMVMNRLFGQFPVELDKTHLDKLEGCCASWLNTAPNPYDQLIRAIKRLGSVKVWAQYPESPAVMEMIKVQEVSDKLTPAQQSLIESCERGLNPPKKQIDET